MPEKPRIDADRVAVGSAWCPERSVAPFGSAPRPTTSLGLEERLRDALRAALWRDFDVEGFDQARISASMLGGGLTVDRLDVDLTGVALTPRPNSPERPAPPAGEPGRAVEGIPTQFADPVAREGAVAQWVSCVARPLTVAGAPVHVSAEFRDVPFAWVQGTEAGLGVETTGDLGPSSGRIHLSLRRDDFVDLIRAAIDLLGEGEFRVLGLRLDLDAPGPWSLNVRGFLRVGRKGLTAGARLHATVEVDDAMALTIPRLRIWSLNPVVAGLLVAARRSLSQVRSRRYALASGALPVRDVRFAVDDDVTVTIGLGR